MHRLVRVKKIEKYIGDEDFTVVYGDCLSDINIEELIDRHENAGKMVTLAVAKPTGRNESLSISINGILQSVQDGQAKENHAWVNACCMVCSKDVFADLDKDCDLRDKLLEWAEEEKVDVYKHRGFWVPIETKRDKVHLENMINDGTAPWIRW